MKTVMCYGDSLTWGFNPSDGTRYPFDQRWTGVLQHELGAEVRVIEEGLNGRTTVWDLDFLPNRNGATMLPPLLESHAPIDVFVLMLGTNDVGGNRRAADAAFGCLSLIWTVQKSQAGPGLGIPQILLVAPPPLVEVSGLMGLYFKGSEEVTKALAEAYEVVATTTGCQFLDSSKFIQSSPVDGVHLDPPENRKLALEIKKIVAPILAP